MLKLCAFMMSLSRMSNEYKHSVDLECPLLMLYSILLLDYKVGLDFNSMYLHSNQFFDRFGSEKKQMRILSRLLETGAKQFVQYCAIAIYGYQVIFDSFKVSKISEEKSLITTKKFTARKATTSLK